MHTILLSNDLIIIFFRLVIFEIVLEIACLEHGYLGKSRKWAKSANRQLRAEGLISRVGDGFSYVVGDAEHVASIQTDVISLELHKIREMCKKKVSKMTKLMMSVRPAPKSYDIDSGIMK